MKNEIKNILQNSFTGVYCDTCKYDDCDDICENCHRKYMNWALSENTANDIASQIMQTIELHTN